MIRNKFIVINKLIIRQVDFYITAFIYAQKKY